MSLSPNGITPSSNPRRVSIIVPARNEQEHLERALTALLDLDYPNVEVIAVDDRSSDQTGAIMDRLAATHANRSRLRVIHVSDLPEGWLGKPHAMWTAARQATGDWLLFTDADIHFRADAVRRALNYAEKNAVDHLVMFPTHTDWSFSKKVMLAGFNILFMFGHRPWKTADPKSRDHIGVGAFNLIRRDVYEKVGTFQALRLEIIEDMRLGKLVKDAGYKQHNVLGPDLLLLDWGDHALDIVHNLTKNSFSLMHFSVPRTVGAFFLLLGLNLLPFIGTLFAPGLAKLPYAVALFSVFCMYVGMSWYSPISPLFVAAPSGGNAAPRLHHAALDVSCVAQRWNHLARHSLLAGGTEERIGKGVRRRTNPRASRLRVHPFDPLSARCRGHEWIREVLCFPRNLVAPELHDAHGVGRLAVVCQDEFGDPKITAANNSPDSKSLFVRLTGTLALYVASTAGSLA